MRPLELEQRGLPAQIAGEIGRRITLGEYKPGDFLPKELEFLDALNVSRTTLREALAILTTKGFIEAKPRLGTRVRAPEFWNTLDPLVLSWHSDAHDQAAVIEELFELRMAIEPLAAKLAARHGTSVEHAKIRQAYVQMTDLSASVTRAIEADIEFHLSIFQASHNRFLLPVTAVIRAALTVSIPKTMASAHDQLASLRKHEEILLAIENKDEKMSFFKCETLIKETYKRNFKL